MKNHDLDEKEELINEIKDDVDIDSLSAEAKQFYEDLLNGLRSPEEALANKNIISYMSVNKDLANYINNLTKKPEDTIDYDFYKALCVAKADSLFAMDDYQLEQFKEKALNIAKILSL